MRAWSSKPFQTGTKASFTGIKWQGHGIWPPTHQSPLVPRSSSVQLHIYLPSVPAWHVIYRTAKWLIFCEYFQSVISHKHMSNYQRLKTDHYLNVYNNNNNNNNKECTSISNYWSYNKHSKPWPSASKIIACLWLENDSTHCVYHVQHIWMSSS